MSANLIPGPPEHAVLQGPRQGRAVASGAGVPARPGGWSRRRRPNASEARITRADGPGSSGPCPGGAPILGEAGRPGERSVGGREGRGAGGVDSCGGRGTSPTYPCLMCPRDHLGRWGLLGNGAKTVGNAAAWGWSSRCLPVGSAHPGGGEGLDGADHGGQGAAAPVEGDNDTEPCPQTALKRAAFGRSPGVVPGGPV